MISQVKPISKNYLFLTLKRFSTQAATRIPVFIATRLVLIALLLASICIPAAHATTYLISWDAPASEPPSELSYYVYYTNIFGHFTDDRRYLVESGESLEMEFPTDPALNYYFAVQALDRDNNPSELVQPRPARLATGPGPGADNSSRVCLFSAGNSHTCFWDFDAYSEAAETYGLQLASGNLLDDSTEQLVVSPGPGMLGAEIRVFSRQGALVAGGQFQAFSYSRFGATVACGDLDGDGIDELVVGAGHGPFYGPGVKVYSYSPIQLGFIEEHSFTAFPPGQGYGVNLACGDLDGDGADEIVAGCGPGPNHSPHVRVFTLTNHGIKALAGANFLAYSTDSMGVNVACGDIDRDGFDEIITGAGPGVTFGPHVRAFDYTVTDMTPPRITPIPGASFFAYSTPRYGVVVAADDVNQDCFAEIITCPGPGANYCGHVRAFHIAGGQMEPLSGFDFFPYQGTGDDTHGAHLSVGLIYPRSPNPTGGNLVSH